MLFGIATTIGFGCPAVAAPPQKPRNVFDSRSFTLKAFGFDMLIAPTTLSKPGASKSLLSADWRNGVSIDGSVPNTSPAEPFTVSGTPLDYTDFTEGGTAGDPTARHRRRIVSLKGALIFVVDETAAEKPHDWTLRFHFAPGEVAYRANTQQVGYAVAVDAPRAPGAHKDPNSSDVSNLAAGLNIWALDDRKPAMETVPLTFSDGSTRSLPRVGWTAAGQKQALFANLIMPFGDDPATDQWEVKRLKSGALAAYGPVDSPITNLIYLKPSAFVVPQTPSNLTVGIDTDAEAAFVRSGSIAEGAEFGDGPIAVQRMALVNASRLSWSPNLHPERLRGDPPDLLPVFQADQPVQSLEAVWAKDTLTVRISDEHARICPFFAKWLIVNGKKRTRVTSGTTMVSLTQ